MIYAKQLKVSKSDPEVQAPEIIDLGHVGEVSGINPAILNTFITGDIIPVISPIGTGKNGETFNINADLVAASIATVVKSEKLMLLTNTKGIMKDDKLLTGIKPAQVEELIDKKVIHGGMLPKVRCAIDALQSGVHTAHIIDGRIEHAVILELFTDEGIGTLIER